VVVAESAKPLDGGAEARIVTVLATLERARRARRPHDCIIGSLGERGVLIAAVSLDVDGAKELSGVAGRVRDDLHASGTESDSWRLGCGPAVRDLADVRTSSEAALDAIHIASAIPDVGDIAVWEELGAWRFLCRIPDDDRVRSAIHPGLAKLIALRDGTTLMETLKTYLEHAGCA
jgi:sugar diacid utilization regulator